MERDGVGWILDQAGKEPLLSKDEELIHARNVQRWMAIRDVENPTPAQKQVFRAGRRSYDRFFRGNLRLVVHIAKRYTGRTQTLDLNDLIQEGMSGLARAIELYDSARGYKFSTYAYWWIRQSITRAITTQDRLIRIPINAHEVLNKMRFFVPKFEEANNRKPTAAECAEHLGVAEATIRRYLHHNNWVFSLDAKISDKDDNSTYLDMVADEKGASDEEREDDLLLDRMRAHFEQLPDAYKHALIRRYGLDGNDPQTYQTIGSEVGVSRERIRQREGKALLALRMQLNKREAC